ncbi:TraR/DksA C4-type zinc finger protein [Idiomarina xiamenensis]|uniref:DnaK suppressor protein n=1 Tax=Idiomarina xiamenensis 10-D-4 TaxID=740709 RepID=K2KDV7_9GAMM|nr:TraR/DksA C4-type zinc finger protein [Idiomarina xiamenensis]EKE80904.1 DnaK suppressor protein [Idiomarina xiamenensis 10-D-4]
MSSSLSAQQLARFRQKLESHMATAEAAGDKQQQQQLQAAMTRLRAGEYGCCLSCGEEISAAKLAHSPAAELCNDCQSLADDSDG